MDVLADILRIALLVFVSGIGLLTFATGRVILTRPMVASLPASADAAPHGME